jgi:hypothetical protein
MTPTLDQRIDALEREFKTVRDLKGIPGVRGPAGSIDAAATAAANAATNAVTERFREYTRDWDARLDALRTELLDLRQELREQMRNLRQEFVLQFGEAVKNEVAASIVGLLVEYHLLDRETCAPTLAADVTAPKVTGGKS